MGHSINRVRSREQARGRQIEPFHHVMAEMLVEPRAPGGTDPIARLQHRPQPRAASAPHQAEVTPVLARHQLDDDIRLPVALDAEHDAFICPLHDEADNRPCKN